VSNILKNTNFALCILFIAGSCEMHIGFLKIVDLDVLVFTLKLVTMSKLHSHFSCFNFPIF